MPVKKFSQLSIGNFDIESTYENYFNNRKRMLKCAHLIIDESFDKFKLPYCYLENELNEALFFKKKIKALASVEDILVSLRREISTLKEQLTTNHANLQQHVQEINRARYYQREVGELNARFINNLNIFTLMLAALVVKDYYFKGESPTNLFHKGMLLLLINSYLLFYGVLDFFIFRKIPKLKTLVQKERQLRQHSEYLIDVESKLTNLYEMATDSRESFQNRSEENFVQREKWISATSTITNSFFKEKNNDSIAAQADEEINLSKDASNKPQFL